MPNRDLDFKSAQEIGKIYQSLTDRGSLVGFFLESASKFIGADEGFLFLAGRQEKLWLEGMNPANGAQPSAEMADEAGKVHCAGKPIMHPAALYLPLLVRNDVLGVAVFRKRSAEDPFQQEELDLALGLSSQMAAALKGILLYEDNMRMERLAAVGQTMGMVLHEIKNIVQLAKLSYEFIRRGIDKKEDKYLFRGVSGMGRAMREMEGFTTDMLNLTKEYEIEPQSLNLMMIIKDLREDLEDKARDFNVKLEFDVEAGFPEVDADPRSLYRALLNLLKNAIEASDNKKAESYVRVRIRSENNEFYTIVVEDNGVGMTAEVKAKLFEAFFSTKGRSGTGLGLLTIERTVKHHRGEISVESEPGKGTCFVLHLPKRITLPPH